MSDDLFAFVFASAMGISLYAAGLPPFFERLCGGIGLDPDSIWIPIVSVRLSQVASGFTVTAFVLLSRLLHHGPELATAINFGVMPSCV